MNLASTEIQIEIEPYGSTVPKIKFGIDDICLNTIEVDKKIILNFEEVLKQGKHNLFIDFFNKEEYDPDTAIIINRVTVESMTVDRFLWSNKYYPRYPQSYKDSQKCQLPEFLSHTTYLGWNGIWRFEFETPIFEWIHRLENLGWLYD